MRLPKTYQPGLYEADIYALWEKSGAFEPQNRGSKENFGLVFPPPNANADLHLGHALTSALHDILIRYHRMRGRAALFLPGADHAGFETWVVYEKKLNKQGKTRFDFAREELYDQVWDFVQSNKINFDNQLRALGASCDWSSYTFSLDSKVINAANRTFKKLWDDKLVYRGERLVNFCTRHGTGFADIEVTHKQVDGHLYHIRYPLTDGSGHLTVATTRPETMLGDVAVAVNPKDDRYRQFVGKTVKLPLTQREIPVIADPVVDRDFGTGAVKITPAHDPNDFEVAQRHDLPMITVIDHEGRLTHDVPPAYRGQPVDKARQLVINDLKEQGLLEKTESHAHSVGHCYKCGTVIQPLPREQWFVDVKPLAAAAIKALRAGKIRFLPAAKLTQAVEYLENIHDWNISRQIAWGIPIPAFQSVDDPDEWIYDERTDQEIITVGRRVYRRDPDVFDTWFSSGQWPYVTLDFPGGEKFKRFYPLDLMETGFDILYPWVCRMIMLGLYVTGDVPFKNVYLHGMIVDEKGRKMSKSRGNVVSPMDVIAQYGSDALRMGLITGMTPGRNQPFSTSRVVAGRNFTNKLWNIARYTESKTEIDFNRDEPKAKTLADAWILNKLNYCVGQVSRALDNYRFSEAYDSLYHFVWNDFADWYVETTKIGAAGPKQDMAVLAYGLATILKLAHPFAPFMTETIWQTIAGERDSLLIIQPWPKTVRAAGDGAAFEDVRAIVSEIRLIKSTLERADLTLYHRSDSLLAEQGELIRKLAGLTAVKSVDDGRGLNLTATGRAAWLDIDNEGAKLFLAKLLSRQTRQAAVVERLERRLTNKAYLKKAPAELVAETKAQLAAAQDTLAKVTAEYDRFAGSA